MSLLADSTTWPPDGPESAVDRAVADLMRYYETGHCRPETAARYLLGDYGSDVAEQAVKHAAQFSEHYFGAQNDAYTAAVLAALREEEG